jgi:hypothetical protein
MENLEGKSNGDLRYIIEYTDKKNEAGEQLMKQNPSNGDLADLIVNGVMIDEASAILKANTGSQLVNEKQLIYAIAQTVINQPGSLDMGQWHCGASHCLAGWAATLHPIAREIEEKNDTKIAGCAVLPNYAYLFFSDNDTVLEKLKEIASV